jgi:hypothetical protein
MQCVEVLIVIVFSVRSLIQHFVFTMEGILVCISLHASYTACKPAGTYLRSVMC